MLDRRLALVLCSGLALAQLAAAEVVNLPYTDPSGQPATVEAVLSTPATPADNGVRRKGVVILHSRAGWQLNATTQYAELFATKGVVALEVRMFNAAPDNPRRYLDQTFAAMDYLARRSDVDPSQIGVMGLSYGASLALYAATQWSAEKFARNGQRFAWHAALYPTCFFHEGLLRRNRPFVERMKKFGFPDEFHDRFGTAPVYVFQGAADRYEEGDPQACPKMVEAIQDSAAKARFTVTVWPDTYHGWDQPEDKTVRDPMGCRMQGCEVIFKRNDSVTTQTKTLLLKAAGLQP